MTYMQKAAEKKPLIEVVGIYPEKFLKGVVATYHIYLINEQMDIRGGKIYQKKSKFFVQLPQGRGTCEETDKLITFPVISFTDDIYEKQVQREIRTKVLAEFLKKARQ